MYLAYTYFVKNKITNQFYYGSRKANIRLKRTPEEDFWIHYFTSSKNIKELISVHGPDSFDILILEKSQDYADCFWEEQKLICENFNNPLCLNKHYIISETGANRFSFRGKIHSEESKEKIRKNRKGMDGKKHSQESINKIKTNHKGMDGKKHSDKTIKKMSDTKIGNTYGSGRKGNTYGPQSTESNEKRSLALKGRTPWNKGLKKIKPE